MFTTVRVSKFLGGSKLDKNGRPAVYLNYISGTPLHKSARVLSGTIAESAGFKDSETYIIKAEKTAVDEVYGDQYSVTKVSTLTGDNLLSLFSEQLKTVVLPEVRIIKKAEVTTPAAQKVVEEIVATTTAAAATPAFAEEEN